EPPPQPSAATLGERAGDTRPKNDGILLKVHLSDLAARSSRSGVLKCLPRLLPSPPHRYPRLKLPSWSGPTWPGPSVALHLGGSLSVKRSVSSPGRISECPIGWLDSLSFSSSLAPLYRAASTTASATA
ncbi:hypothetical protein NL676_023830, partial [Syzygium grande]